MDLLLHFRAFVRVAELGGFSAAARVLNASQPSVSRQVADLEAALKARLLHRSASGVTLTEEGRRFLDAARAALEQADAAMSAVGQLRGEVEGLVRIGCSIAFGRLHIIPRLPGLFARHPGLHVDLVMSDAVSDLVLDGLDFAVRIGVVTDPELVVRRIGLTRRSIVASPDYLARAGTPQHPDDLAHHECIRFARHMAADEWQLEGPEGAFRVRVQGRLRVSTSEAVRQAVLEGIGLGLCPVWMFGPELEEGRVVGLLPDWTPTALPIQAVFSSRRQIPARVRAVVEYLAAEFRLDSLLTDYAAAE
ncbi:MAG TPA: LysR substrate-binding domain-containing protein [Crenalkalicoccus sp.]|nr:LysR substrate-binding domain-containing protein [Crenalkalicoccus sp.]